ncbi:BgTH12-05561, partial [Blumeria graminis f. sp. triticale]
PIQSYKWLFIGIIFALPLIPNLPPRPPSPLPHPLLVFAQKGGEKSLTEKLLSNASAADTRNFEATIMFQNFACILDDALSDKNTLPQLLKQPFRESIADILSPTSEVLKDLKPHIA